MSEFSEQKMREADELARKLVDERVASGEPNTQDLQDECLFMARLRVAARFLKSDEN